MSLHLHLMHIYVQSGGGCVSPRAPDPQPAAPAPTGKGLSLFVRRGNTFEIKFCSLKRPLGRGCLI